MASITRQKVGRYTYLYESVSFRDEEGRARNHKTKIGRIDPDTGETVYTREYLNRLAGAGIGSDAFQPKKLLEESRPEPEEIQARDMAGEILEGIRSSGCTGLLYGVARKAGLLRALSAALPETWEQVFQIACFALATGDPLSCCRDWIRQNTRSRGELEKDFHSLLLSITEDDRRRFTARWMSETAESTWTLLDALPSSPYREFMTADPAPVPRMKPGQLTVSVLTGAHSGLPAAQILHRGRWTCVEDLNRAFEKAVPPWPVGKIRFFGTMDFFSAPALNTMLAGTKTEFQGAEHRWIYDFCCAVPLTGRFARSLIQSCREEIDTFEHTLFMPEGSVRGMSFPARWPGVDEPLHTFLFFNPAKQALERELLYRMVSELLQEASGDPDRIQPGTQYGKYLQAEEQEDGSRKVSARREVLEREIQGSGWMILVSNVDIPPGQMLELCRRRDLAAAGFSRTLDLFGLAGARASADSRTENAMFIGFIAQILRSAVDRVMREKNLYASWSMQELLRRAEAVRDTTAGGLPVSTALEEDQKRIFEAFDLPLPDTSPAPAHRKEEPGNASDERGSLPPAG